MVFTKEKIGCEKNKKDQKHVYHVPGAVERTPHTFKARGQFQACTVDSIVMTLLNADLGMKNSPYTRASLLQDT